MRRALAILCLTLLAAPAAQAADPPLVAKVSACTESVEASARAATFTGSMPSLRKATRLAMRFELLERVGDGPFVSVGAQPTGWGTWERSERKVPGFILSKRVAGLQYPKEYRAVVRYRWYSRTGKVLKSALRRTSSCEQRDPRPDLAVGGLTAAGAEGEDARYEIVLRNDGRSGAAAFGVVLEVDGAARPAVTAPPLAAGGQQTIVVGAPRCRPGSSITVRVDPLRAIDEADEADGVVTRPCPLL